MSTEEAFLIMDQQVAGIEAFEHSLVIDYDPLLAGFAQFYITFEGTLYMKEDTSIVSPL